MSRTFHFLHFCVLFYSLQLSQFSSATQSQAVMETPIILFTVWCNRQIPQWEKERANIAGGFLQSVLKQCGIEVWHLSYEQSKCARDTSRGRC